MPTKFKAAWKMGLAPLGILAFAAPICAWAHGDAYRSVRMNQQDLAPQLAGKVHLSFDLTLLDQNIPLTDEDLLVVHERKLHVFIFDEALQEFHHVHPVYQNGRWETDVDIPRSGKYRIWAQGHVIATGEDFYSQGEITIKDGIPPHSLPSELDDIRSGIDGISRVRMSSEYFNAGRSAMPVLEFSRTDGTAPELTPFLGAMAHIVIVPLDGSTLLHVHPMDSGISDNRILIHTVFPRVGDYRVWIQFVDGDVERTIPLSVKILR